MNPKEHISSINLPGSKSISNRLLMIEAISNINFEIKNLSNSDDTIVLQKILQDIKSRKSTIDVNHAGTTMRFLCAYLSARENETIVLTGSERMKERPIKDLVLALTQLGADIQYLENEGYPPLKITGKKLKGGEININASVSSQFISSLLLIAPLLEDGLKINLQNTVVSPGYINLTIELMKQFGANITWDKNTLTIKNQNYTAQQSTIFNESDWSAASYFYSVIALSDLENIELIGLTQTSFQPDAKAAEIFKKIGVETSYKANSVTLTKTKSKINHFEYDFTDCPDIAQTLAVTCLGMGITADLTGLKTLKIKETDRIVALKNELEKFGAIVEITNVSIHIKGFNSISKNLSILVNTYNDHRMAMSFAPLQFLYPNISFENKNVVSKSFPHFWDELSKLNIRY